MSKIVILIVLFISLNLVLSADDYLKTSIGLGLGIPYGMYGANMDYFVNPHVALTAGFGTTEAAGAGYAIGSRYYFVGPDKTFRPRLTALAGINGSLKKDVLRKDAKNRDSANDIVSIEETYPGASLGLGALITWGSRRSQGIDLDVYYIASSGVYSRISELNDKGYNIKRPGRINISFGFRGLF
jgi:hypothetical protein